MDHKINLKTSVAAIVLKLYKSFFYLFRHFIIQVGIISRIKNVSKKYSF